MGEVFRARDTRLERDVAVKVLPPEFAQNAQLKLRFEREARIISQLEHPNICRLYDVGDDYLVMELLDGETLADRVTRGPLTVADVLKYGAQIAEALDRAHRAGVIHRDLKPGNVMLTKSGAKLLDFGLAKSGDLTVNVDGATVQKALTQEGTILGTFQYMAPEQLEGLEAGACADIFALGAVLYEMASGRRAFEGKTKTSLIAAIVKEQPRSLSQIQPLTPPALEHVIAKCLEKDANDRWQSAHDVAQELKWIGEAGAQAGVATTVATRRKSMERVAWMIAGAGVIAAIAAGFVAWRAVGNRETPRVMRFAVPSILTARPAEAYGLVAVSRDGGHVVYSASDGETTQLFRRPVDQLEGTQIPGTEGAVQPFFSPDGKWVGFFAHNTLKKVALDGGQPIVLGRATEPRGGEWLEDDTIVFCPFYYGGIERVPAAGGAAKAVSIVDRKAGERSHRWPRALPGGKVILYSVGTGGTWDDAKVVAQRLDTGVRKVVINAGCDARYLPTGHLVYVRGTSLYAVAFDAQTLEVHGQPVEVVTGVANHAGGGADFAVSANGMLVYFSPGVAADEGGRLVMFDRRGGKVDAALPPFVVANPHVSPDGTKIVGTRGNEVWTFDLLRATHTRLTAGVRTILPAWSADGSRVFYASEREGPWRIYTRSADGSDEERRITEGTEPIMPADVSPDGTLVLAHLDRKETGADVALVSVGDGRIRPLVQSEADERPGVFSPDGKWIAYFSNESGHNEVYVRRADGSAGRWQISNGGNSPKWVREDEITYQNGGRLMSVAVKTEPAFTAAPPQLVLERNFVHYDLARDGRILMVTGPDASSAPGRLNVVVNWFEDVKARVK